MAVVNIFIFTALLILYIILITAVIYIISLRKKNKAKNLIKPAAEISGASDEELTTVITAAAAAFLSIPSDRLIVRSFRQARTPLWNRIARLENHKVL